MKTFLKFSGIIAFVLALVAFILMMATHSVVLLDNTKNWYSGVSAIFGGGTAQVSYAGLSINGNVDAKLAWTALIAWILVLVSMLILCLGVVLPLLKIKALDKVAGLLNLVAVIALIVGGILLFFTVPAFGAANDWNNTKGWGLGAGWVIAAILAILGGVVAILPAAADFLAKKK